MRWLCVALVLAQAAPAAAQTSDHAPAPAAPHAAHGSHAPQEPAPPPSGQDHTAHSGHEPAAAPLPSFIPVPSDADRAAAFPDVQGHAVHDKNVNYFVLLDRLEWQAGGDADAVGVETKGWVGRDINRLWYRVDGAGEDGDDAHAEAQLLYGRAIARWWEVVAGVRQDVGPGPNRTWAAVGLQGLAPYWFDVELTAYVGAGGRAHVRLESEYELLITNRLVLQPVAEVDIYGKSDPERGIGSGLSSGEAGMRLRYEFRREFAPYVGVTWNRKFFGTADRARAAGEGTGSTRLTVGLRLWL